MAKSVRRIRALEIRKISHPIFPNIEKYWLTVAAQGFSFGH